MKKVLMLGGSHFQASSIKKAREMGLYVISCDYLPLNPGHKYAHEFHNVSTTDKEAVLALATKLKIDGVVCYASDPAAPTAAYVAGKLSLPGQPYEAVEILANKDKFRAFLTDHGFRVPRARGFSIIEEAIADFSNFKLPVMVKPVDSSGSKGVSKVSSLADLESAIKYALIFSRCKRFIIEEYIEKNGYQVAGDGFSVNGELVFRCFANEHFNKDGNPFVPIGESWPYYKPENMQVLIHDDIQRLFSLLGMKTGAYNFDVRIDEHDKPVLMEVGPRNGGNLIPQVTKYATGVDMVEYTIKAAMDLDCSDLKMVSTQGFWSCYMLHSKVAGVLDYVWIDEKFRKENVIECDVFPKQGDEIEAFNGSNGTLGTLILKYESMDEMLYKMDNMEKFVCVKTV